MSQRDFNPSSTPSSPNIDYGLSGSDTVVETTFKSWFQRILDSLVAILIGLLLVVISGGLGSRLTTNN